MKRQKGFTLIELLIVVAIIGIIAAIAIPNLVNAINRARQKRTMADMRTIGTSIEQYAVDNNFYPQVASDMGALQNHLSPTYVRKVVRTDGWSQNLSLLISGVSEYTLVSGGKDRGFQGCTNNLQTTDFNSDICYSNGEFVQWPEGTQS